MHEVGYKSGKKPSRRELGNPIISNMRKSLTSRMEGQRKEIVLLEWVLDSTGSRARMGQSHGWMAGAMENMEPLKDKPPDAESESEVIQSCPTLRHRMDCSLPGSSVHGIFQARVLEWVVISSSRRSPWPRDWSQVSRIVSRHFTIWATRGEVRGRRKIFDFSVFQDSNLLLVSLVSWTKMAANCLLVQLQPVGVGSCIH